MLRLADMDREGVAAEFVFHGDCRLGDLFHNGTNREYPLEAWEAGAQAWNRWAADTFGFATDRFLLTAAVGPCVDIDAAVAEIHWIADHGFTAHVRAALHDAPRHAAAVRRVLGAVLGGAARSAASRSSCTPGSARSRASCSR